MKTAMIVDDSKIMRRMIKKYLINLDYTIVCEASNTDEAVDKYFEFEPDLITLDVAMPGSNGITALTKILKQNKNAKIIMITSHGEESIIMDAIAHGASGYILKPITLDKIHAQLSQL